MTQQSFTTRSARARTAALAIGVVFAGCAAPQTPPPATAEAETASVETAGAAAPASSAPEAVASAGQPSPASTATKAANDALLKAYPFSDEQDFADAKKGLIAPLPNEGVIKDANGKVVWNLKLFTDYIKQGEKAPETVNPSLWREAQLLMINGLFEVVPGVYQVRGADLANMTIVEGQRGLTIYDPLGSAETAKAALDLYYAHRPSQKKVLAVIYSHSHIDHFGGVRGVVDEADVKAGKVKIYAPEGFLENAIAENVYAGTAMSRRASYMYGNLLPQNAQGQLTAGLGITTSSGILTLIAPTDLIKKSGETRTIDGLRYEFISAPGSEAPSEIMWYVPKFKLISTAEDSAHTMHNLYTLRGAKTRDAEKWPGYLNDVLKAWGAEAQVEIGMHHWPTWGEAVVKHIKAQRDIYKFLHDQTLHFANMGFTMNELPEKVVIPPSLTSQWSTHGYYGSQSHNVRAVYNYYLGYFDGNPANLNPLPPEAVAVKYVDAMGGVDGVMKVGRQALASGEYRWGAEAMKHLVFAKPDNQAARNLLADLLEQQGYQAESGPWRNFYLAGAKELRDGVKHAATPDTASQDIMGNMSSALIFGFMGIQLDGQKAVGKKITLNWSFPDLKEKHTLFLENSVLNHWPDYQDKNADASLQLDRAVFDQLLAKKLTFQDAVSQNKLKVEGDPTKLAELMELMTDLSASFWFNIVSP